MLEEIGLSWFRGAAKRISLETNKKSVVIHGPNGSGKSSFVDGIEYILSQGKVQHLAHAYSGRRQEHGIINTQAKAESDRHVELLYKGQSVKGVIAENGACSISNENVIVGWEPRRIILRQDEVNDFVKASAGEKYSVLLPLIGLDPLENVAVNLRALARKVQDATEFTKLQGRLAALEQDWEAKFGTANWDEVKAILKAIYKAHVSGASEPASLKELVNELRPVLDGVVNGLQADQAAHLALKTAAEQPLRLRLEEAQLLTKEAIKVSQPLLDERLSILESAHEYAEQIDPDASDPCPACGQLVLGSELKAHIASEKERLEAAISIYGERNAALRLLADAIAIVQNCLSRPQLSKWRETTIDEQCKALVASFCKLDSENLRDGKFDTSSTNFVELLSGVVALVEQAASHAPPSIEKLVGDLGKLDAASRFPEIIRLRAKISEVTLLTGLLTKLENETREEIKEQTKSVIKDISDDIQDMWSILHPHELIDGVQLYQPEGPDKALDIGLRFYGRQQMSPRLTLSEGHRNSLGLCVFLSLAKRDRTGSPLVLDDVVSSFDREHRSYVTDLLTSRFSDRQTIIFTHDYDWYVELRTRLPAKGWRFGVLLPWREPTVGIRWASNAGGFDLARELLDTDPGAAAAKARAVMDTQLAAVAEVLGVLVPFVKGPKNDLRFAGDLLQRLSSDCERKLRKGNGDDYAAWDEPVQRAKAALALLVPYANPGSHGRYVSETEARRLIDACDTALRSFTCETCEHPVWNATVSGRHHRCDCDAIRWKI